MTDRRPDPGTDADLRRRAEELARQRAAQSSDDAEAPSPAAAGQLLHELRVHQIELEMQNEELRRAQVELEASRARYFDLYDLAPVGYVTLSEAGLILEANLTVAAILRVDRRALVEQPFTRFILPEDQDTFYRHRQQLFETGAPQTCELRLQRAGAAPFWARVEATAARDADGAPICRAVLSDITEPRAKEEALRESEERFRSLVDNTGEGIGIVDLEDRFVYANRSADEVFGVPAGALVGHSLREFVAPEVFAGFGRLTHERRHGESSTYHLEIRRPDGSARTLSVTTTTRFDDQDRPVGSYGVFRDVTERRRLEASLAQADRLASMGMLAAGVAHEINNPLAYVLCNVESLAEDLPKLAGVVQRCNAALSSRVDDAAFAALAGDAVAALQPAALEDAADRAREALEGARRIQEISRSLGTFARVESAELTEIDVNSTIEHAATMALNEIRFRARLVKDLGPVPTVRATAGKLAQVFLNLLINAAHAIPEGDADRNRITVRTWAEGPAVLAEVADTGTGIPPEHLERIFEPFFTTKKLGEGCGLGLAICRTIVTGFGGDLRVESQVGKGTRFVVRLPMPRAAPTARDDTAAPETPPVAAVRGRILVVDDEAALRRGMQRLLGAAHEVVTAASGAEAQAILERDSAFDLILCDLMMPEMSGMDLHEWLARRNPALAAQVVFVTGGAFTPRASEYVASVGNLRIEKPFDAANLAKLVAELVVAAKSRR